MGFVGIFKTAYIAYSARDLIPDEHFKMFHNKRIGKLLCEDWCNPNRKLEPVVVFRQVIELVKQRKICF